MPCPPLSVDVFPPADIPPDLPEPPLPGKGPFMAALPLLKSNGANVRLEACHALSHTFHTAAVASYAGGGSDEHSGRGMSAEEQDDANKTRWGACRQ